MEVLIIEGLIKVKEIVVWVPWIPEKVSWEKRR